MKAHATVFEPPTDHSLLEKARQFLERGELKEFNRIVDSILGLRKASLSVHEIEDPHDPSQVIYEPNELKRILSEKYRTLFCLMRSESLS